jgi:hypothetical protein
MGWFSRVAWGMVRLYLLFTLAWCALAAAAWPLTQYGEAEGTSWVRASLLLWPPASSTLLLLSYLLPGLHLGARAIGKDHVTGLIPLPRLLACGPGLLPLWVGWAVVSKCRGLRRRWSPFDRVAEVGSYPPHPLMGRARVFVCVHVPIAYDAVHSRMQPVWLDGDCAYDACGKSSAFKFATAEKWMLAPPCTIRRYAVCGPTQSLFLGGFPYNVRRDFPSGVVNVVDLTTEFIARGDMTQGRR